MIYHLEAQFKCHKNMFNFVIPFIHIAYFRSKGLLAGIKTCAKYNTL